MQSSWRYLMGLTQCFNPHPARRPDAMFVAPPIRNGDIMFQSSPGQKAGCNLPSWLLL